MKLNKQTMLFAAVAVIGLGAGITIQLLRTPPAPPMPTHGVEVTAPDVRPDFTLLDLEGKTRSASEWDGKVLMVNFWAAWCPPCRREIPAFIQLKETYGARGFDIVGIAIDSKPNIVDFTDPMDMNYPILMAEREGLGLSRAYGNRLGVLPYTVIVDRQGKIVYTHRSELTFEEAEKVILPLL